MPYISVEIADTSGQIISSLSSDEQGQWETALPAGQYQFSTPAGNHPSWHTARDITINQPQNNILLSLPPEANAIAYGNFESDFAQQAWPSLNGQSRLTAAAFDGTQALRLGDQPGLALTCTQNNQAGQLWTRKQAVIIPDQDRISLSFISEIVTTQTQFDYAWFEVVLIANGSVHYLVDWGQVWQAQPWQFTGD